MLIYALELWHEARFGELDTERIARVVIGSSLSFSLGVQTILSSLLLSTLKLNVRSLPRLDVTHQA